MIRLDVIEIEEPSSYALDGLKAYAAIATDAQDSLLLSALATAFDKVQRTADVALLPGRWQVVAEDHPGYISVYMGGRVTSVRRVDGSSVSFNQQGRRVIVGTNSDVVIEFTTEVIPANYARYITVVCQYATALYDGQDERTLNRILNQCL